ncbi:MAG: glycosyltransferase family 4 protein, partial [Nitrososphaeria archaeon]
MKVTYILAVNWGAVPTITAELANAASQYVDVVVLKPKDDLNYLFSENVQVMDIFEPLRFDRSNVMSVLSPMNFKGVLSYSKLKKIDELKPDIIVLQEIYPHCGLFFWLFRFHKKYPTIYNACTAFDHIFIRTDSIIFSTLASLNEVVKRLIFPEKIIVQREETKKILIKRGIRPEKIAIIPHGVSKVKFHQENDENRVLLFGNLIPDKGIKYFIEAVQIASREIPIIGVIAGSGNFSRYRKYIKHPNLFEIHNRYIREEEIQKFFSSSKIVVLPYLSDNPKSGGHSGVLSLAFSFCKPVIVSNLEKFLELVDDGKEGYIVPQRDSKALADA